MRLADAIGNYAMAAVAPHIPAPLLAAAPPF
jgi:hypothetical protein